VNESAGRRVTDHVTRFFALLAAALLLAATSACAPDGQPCVSLSVPSYETPTALADASDYIVTARLITEPVRVPVNEQDDLMHYWVADAKITEEIAQRPGTTSKLAKDMIIPIGTQLLNSSSSLNCDDQASFFPDETDTPATGEAIVAFLDNATLGGHGPGFAAMGEGVMGPDGKVTMRGVPGPLNHQVLDLAAVTTDVAQRLATSES
jgi:hypothetical protein